MKDVDSMKKVDMTASEMVEHEQMRRWHEKMHEMTTLDDSTQFIYSYDGMNT